MTDIWVDCDCKGCAETTKTKMENSHENLVLCDKCAEGECSHSERLLGKRQ